jgi:hypothetical protein
VEKHPSCKHVSVIYIPIPPPPVSFPGLVEFFFLLLLPLRCLIDFRNLGNTVSLLLALFTALFLVWFLKIPAPELIVQATEEKVRAVMKSEEQAKELQILHEKTTDYVTKSNSTRSIRKRHTGNFAVYVMNRKLSEKLN